MEVSFIGGMFFANLFGMVLHKVEKSNVLMLLQTYLDLERKVSIKYFEFLISKVNKRHKVGTMKSLKIPKGYQNP